MSIEFRTVAAIVGFSAAFVAGWTVCNWRHHSELADLKATHLADRVKRQQDYIAQFAAATAANVKLSDDLAASDKKYTDELKRAKDETKRLSDCVATGKCGLRVNATCPGPVPRVELPGAAPGSGVDTATAPRLTPDAQRDYFALRDALDGQRAQLAACVAALGRITGQLAP